MADRNNFIMILRQLKSSIDENDLTNTNGELDIKNKLHELVNKLIVELNQQDPTPEIVQNCLFELEEIINEFDIQNPYIQRGAPHFYKLRELRNLVFNNYPELS